MTRTLNPKPEASRKLPEVGSPLLRCRTTQSPILLVQRVLLSIVESRSQQALQEKTHFVSPSCRAEHPGNKKPANHAEGKNTILSVLLVVLNILGARSQQTVQILKQHILLGLLVVTNIVQTRSQQRMQKKTPFCYG